MSKTYKEILIKEINNCLSCLINFTEEEKEIFNIDKTLENNLNKLKECKN